MQSVKKLLILIIFLGVTQGITGDFDYKGLPPLYEAANYGDCLEQTSASYCWVYAEIQANNFSTLWHNLWNHSNAYAYRYRHDQVYRGICTSQCNNGDVEDSIAGDKSVESNTVRMARRLHAISRNQKVIADNQDNLQHCVNSEFRKRYNLSVKTFTTYCENPKEPLEKGRWYYFTISILICLVLLNITSTMYDWYLKNKQKNPKENSEYYDKQHESRAHQNLCSFSLYRNYRRLVLPNHSPMGKDLQFVDCFRTILSMVIIGEHTICTQFVPLKNPEFYEQLYSKPFTLIIIHIVACIELFFMLSGLMLCLKFKKGEFITPQSSIKECLNVFVRLLISRYLRYMPSLVLPILITSNILLYLKNGPFWRHILEPTVILCRSEWWSNLLMTTNLGINNCCWIHTWYISADFQLYAIFLAVLVLIAKYPKYKMHIYTVIGTVGALLPTIVGYLKKLDSIGTMNLESYRHIFLQSIETGEYLYLSTYSNLNGFFIGLMCGEIYFKYLQHDSYKKSIKSRLKYFVPIGWVIIPAIWYLGSKLLFQEPSIWTALYAILHRPLSLAIVAIIVVLYNMCGNTYGGIPNLPVFRPLARISYQVYIWHLIILFVMFASSDKLIEISVNSQVLLFFKIYILAVIVSFFIAIMVEYPIAELLRVFELKKKSKINKNS